MGKVDATIETTLAEEYGVRGYPTLKFFRGGSEIEYNGGRTSEEIISWVNKKTGPAATEIKTIDEAEALIKDNKVVVIGFFKDIESASAKTFLSVASGVDEYPFGITNIDELFRYLLVDENFKNTYIFAVEFVEYKNLNFSECCLIFGIFFGHMKLFLVKENIYFSFQNLQNV